MEAFKEVSNKYADMIISCGASTVGANIFLKYENNAKAITIMKPGLGRRKKFDLVILPRHDVSEKLKPNILITEAAPNRITESTVKHTVLRNTQYAIRNTNQGIGLLIGGDAKDFKLGKAAVGRVVDGISRIAEEMDLEMFVSTSRRTSSEIDFLIKDKFSNNQRCKLLVIANEENKEGVVQEIFDQSGIVIISPESISMISEAASSGKHTVVFKDASERSEAEPPRRGRARAEQSGASPKGTKYERAVASLEKQGYIKTALPHEIYNVTRMLLEAKPVVKRLDDRKRITKRLEGII